MNFPEAFHSWPREVQDEVLGHLGVILRWAGWVELGRTPLPVKAGLRRIIDIAGQADTPIQIEEYT